METKKFKTVIDAEEEHLVTKSTTTKVVKKSLKTTKTKHKLEQIETKDTKIEAISNSAIAAKEMSVDSVDSTTPTTPATPPAASDASNTEDTSARKKVKSKKSKKCEYDNQNISVKTSFNKFDALQKRNLIHNPQDEQHTSCRLCNKPVYKMEEVKAEKGIYHKTCFRCKECAKQLKFDNYQSHEGNLYCIVHFKLLFVPKVVEDVDPKPRKAELIIRESQPVELPPDVVRASDKPDLGLEELQQLNVRSRFQVFEDAGQRKREEEQQQLQQRQNTTVKRSTSILSKLAKLQQHGLNSSVDGSTQALVAAASIDESASDGEDSDISRSDGEEQDGEDEDMALVRSKRRTQKERPVGLGDAMNDIKTRFEKGHMLSKEERREERKQEIQNIRSRLFMGKQAKIKEMYQQAVAESEQGITSVGKKPEVEIGDAARSIKERFEKGEMFNEKGANSNLSEDADVFESAISKKSRSIFMELDANVSSNTNGNSAVSEAQQHELKKNRSGLLTHGHYQAEQENLNEHNTDVVKYDEKPDDVKIATSELSEKFKFFETYRPSEGEKRQFRMTPPREGVVKMPTPDSDAEDSGERQTFNDNVLQKTQTTSTMLSKFREMEQKKGRSERHEPKPLKCFTPPPEDARRYYESPNSEEDEDSDDNQSDDSANEEEQSLVKLSATDEALKEAQNAARAKQLRAKFEKWQANEIRRELNEGRVDVYSQDVSDDTNIESTKTIRERFENMKSLDRKSPNGPRYQVNRFV